MSNDMPSVMSGLDVVVPCPRPSPLGRVILEGMAAGRAVVGTRSGGVPELINDGVDGILVPPGDPHILAENLLALEQDAGLRGRLGSRARQKAMNQFGLNRHVRRMEQVYWEVLVSP